MAAPAKPRPAPEAEAPALASVRLDVFLDVACLMPTRSQAGKACAGSQVEVNGEVAKAHRAIRVGDEIAIRNPAVPGGRRTFVVQGLCERNIPKAEARKLLLDTTPKPSPEDLELRRLLRNARVLRPAGAGRPTKRQRRDLDKLRPR